MNEDGRRIEVSVEERRTTFEDSYIHNPNPCEFTHVAPSQKERNITEQVVELTNH